MKNTDESPIHTCQGCNFRFMTKNILDDHKKNAHGQKNKIKNYNEDPDIDKDRIIKDLKEQLIHERKAHTATKKSYELLEKEYRACETVVTVVEEEKERLKIHVKDLKGVIDLTEIDKNTVITSLIKGTYDCEECEYPCKSRDDMELHMNNHQSQVNNSKFQQQCNLCLYQFTKTEEFRNHLTIKHVQYNCDQCSFQAGTKIVLSKHMNLVHRKENEHSDDTFKCEECTEQFSARWNLNNHVRDVHEPTIDYKFFKQGRCSFPIGVCWNRHVNTPDSNEVSPPKESSMKCYDCRKLFINKTDLMKHRIADHPEKVKACKHGDRCSFILCWYKHKETNANVASLVTNEAGNEITETEIRETNTKDFQNAPIKEKPPLNQGH